MSNETAIVTMILGESGTGKTTSLRNLNPDEVILFRSTTKPLPFKATNWRKMEKGKGGSIVDTSNAQLICAMLGRIPPEKKIVIFDDFQYIMSNEFMNRSKERGFDKFTEIAKNAWDIIVAATNARPDVRFYLLSHINTDEYGTSRIKTIGKLLDEKITLEGMVSIVFRSQVRDNQYFFNTKNNGRDTVKTPMGMFEESEIDNDLALIDATICDYYGIENNTTQSTEEGK